MYEIQPDMARPRRVEFFTRDRGVLQAGLLLDDGQALASFMGSRHGSINLVDAFWITGGARADDLTLRLSEIIWARSLESDVEIVAFAAAERERLPVELVLAGDIVLRGELPVVPGQSISEHLGSRDDFPVLLGAHLDGDVPLGDVVVNQGALRSVRDLRSRRTPEQSPQREEPKRTGADSGSVTDLLIGILEFGDPFFRGSSSLTRLLCIEIGREMGLAEEDVAALAEAALLRDLGRLVEDGVLGRQLSVVAEEEVRRRGEAQINLTMSLLAGIDVPAATKEAIRFHHERFDGTGYPEGRRADGIPLTARILAVAESYAAIIAPRPHRPPRRIESAMEELQTSGGRQLDPVVIFALRRVLRSGDPHVLRFGLRHHILVVDPDSHRATTLAMRFCSQGYLGEWACDLAGARDRLRRVPIEALIVSGEVEVDELRTFLDEIRGSRYFANLPTIVVDAVTSESRADLLDAGADRCFPAGTGFDEIRASLGALIGRIARTRSSSGQDGPAVPYAPWHALQGELGDFSLPWLLQMLRYDGRTACVLVRREQEEAVIFLEHGEPRHATFGNLRGQPALRAILAWRHGDFVVQPDVPAPERTIDASLMQVLLEEAVVEDYANVIFGAVR
jgi:hypothetical protein